MPEEIGSAATLCLPVAERKIIRDAFLSTDRTVTFTTPDGEPLSLWSIFGRQPRSRNGQSSATGYFLLPGYWSQPEDMRDQTWYHTRNVAHPQSAVGDMLIHCGTRTSTRTFVGEISLVSMIRAKIDDKSKDKLKPNIINYNTVYWSSVCSPSSGNSDWLSNVSHFKVSDRDKSDPRLLRWSVVDDSGPGTLRQRGGPEIKVDAFESVHLELSNLHVHIPTATEGVNSAPSEEDEPEDFVLVSAASSPTATWAEE